MRWMNDPFDDYYGLREWDSPFHMLDRFERRLPYWLNHSLLSAQNLGETMGEVRIFSFWEKIRK